MKIYTAHLRGTGRPVLVREGFAWGALAFGPLWLLAHRAWIAAALTLCAGLLIATLAPANTSMVALVALAWMLGLVGQDLRRWSLARQGYLLAHVVAAPDEDIAFAKLLDRRPDLIGEALR